ncbi:MAG: efflux RND transporter periplasmic adaptor subunit [Betaproteobacteria bacterium]
MITRPDSTFDFISARAFSCALAALFAACALAGCSDKNNAQAEAKKTAPAIPVLVAQAVEKHMPLRLHAIGNVETVATVAVKARVDGQIFKVYVRDGQDVAKGALLFQLDPKPYESLLAQSQAQLAQNQAQLEYLRGQESRYQELLAQNFVSREGYAQVASNFHAAEASANAAAAAVESARVNLAYTTIRAPIGGRAGKVLLSEGNLVKANDTNALVVINQISPIYVSFAVPEQYLAEIRANKGDSPMRVEAEIEKGKLVPGALAFADNTVDATTGTIRLRGLFTNSDKQLWPGQYVDTWITLRDEERALVVPAQAIQTGPSGQYAYVVKKDSSTELRAIAVSRTDGEEAVIASGLEPGETVVTDGASRLLPGSRVSVKSAEKAS